VGSSVDQAPHEQLTPLEAEVLLAVASGQRNAEIARHMRRSSKTVEKHRANLLRKLGFRNVAQLTAYAIRHGLLNTEAILTRRRS
jgi:DNA-binding NarL/FixJ family response regulator